MLRAVWARGVIDDHSIALICSPALFEELTDGCIAAIEILNQAFTMVLPGNQPSCQCFSPFVFCNFIVLFGVVRNSK